MLDEPLSALDAKVRVFLRKQIKYLQRKLGVTTIMVTHDQEEAQTMADRIFVMKDGEIIQVGTPTEIYTQSQLTFYCRFYWYDEFYSSNSLLRTTKHIVIVLTLIVIRKTFKIINPYILLLDLRTFN